VFNALAVFLAIFCSLELHAYLERRRVNPEEPTLKQRAEEALRSILPQEKAEYMPPMNEEEYENHLLDLSGRNDLLTKLDAKLPWNSEHPKSPPSDS